jgi:hypothetical protein
MKIEPHDLIESMSVLIFCTCECPLDGFRIAARGVAFRFSLDQG